MRYRRIAAYFMLAAFLVYCFFVFESNFHGPDEPVYFSYIASIVEDGDFNVANQMYAQGERFAVSPTYNVPDFHNHGGVVFWAPFYLYARSLYRAAGKLGVSSIIQEGYTSFIKCGLSSSTVLFGFIALVLIYFFCRVFFAPGIALFTTATLFLGTPYFHSLVVDTGNPNMIGVALSVLSLWCCLCIVGAPKGLWFIYGVFFSLCAVIRTEFWFQIIFIALFFAYGVVSKKINPRQIAYFIIGLVPATCLNMVNSYLKYGTLHSGEAKLFSTENFYFFEQLFSSYRGFFYTSPVFYLCMLGLLLSLISLWERPRKQTIGACPDELLFVMLGLYVAGKIFFLSFRYAWGGGTPGARILLTELPVFVLLFARVFKKQRPCLRIALYLVSVLCIFWNALVISEYMSGADIRNLTGFYTLASRMSSFRHLFGLIFTVKGALAPRFACGLPMLMLGIAFIFYATPRLGALFSAQDSPARARALFGVITALTLFLSAGYALATGFNVYNNRRNVSFLRQQGYFSNAQIVTKNQFEHRENAGSLEEIIVYYKFKGNMGKMHRLKKLKRQLEAQ
mgnify:CR=1 FL=1